LPADRVRLDDRDRIGRHDILPRRLALALRGDIAQHRYTIHHRPPQLGNLVVHPQGGGFHLRTLLDTLDAAALPLRPTDGPLLEGAPAAYAAEHYGNRSAEADLLPARHHACPVRTERVALVGVGGD